MVIASGVSNGGGAVLRAVEADAEGLLDGAVVSEPNAQPGVVDGLRIRMGDRPAVIESRHRRCSISRCCTSCWQPAAILAPESPAPFTAIPEATAAIVGSAGRGARGGRPAAG